MRIEFDDQHLPLSRPEPCNDQGVHKAIIAPPVVGVGLEAWRDSDIIVDTVNIVPVGARRPKWVGKSREVGASVAIVLLFGSIVAVLDFADIHPSEFSLREWIEALGGGATALAGIIWGFIAFRDSLVGNKSPKLHRLAANAIAATGTIGIYCLGANMAFNLVLNSGGDRNDAAVHSIYSWFSVSFRFAEHLYDSRNMPLPEAIRRFEAITKHPK